MHMMYMVAITINRNNNKGKCIIASYIVRTTGQMKSLSGYCHAW